MVNLQLLTVDNGSPNYPGDFAKKEREIISKSCTGKVLHIFSGRSDIGDVRVDFSQPEATINQDVFEYMKTAEGFDTIILDPPYNEKFAGKYDKLAGGNTDQFIIFANVPKTTELFNWIIEIAPKVVIIKSWNYYVPKGYFDAGSYLCYAGGYRKPTILMICKKMKTLEEF